MFWQVGEQARQFCRHTPATCDCTVRSLQWLVMWWKSRAVVRAKRLMSVRCCRPNNMPDNCTHHCIWFSSFSAKLSGPGSTAHSLGSDSDWWEWYYARRLTAGAAVRGANFDQTDFCKRSSCWTGLHSFGESFLTFQSASTVLQYRYRCMCPVLCQVVCQLALGTSAALVSTLRSRSQIQGSCRLKFWQDSYCSFIGLSMPMVCVPLSRVCHGL